MHTEYSAGGDLIHQTMEEEMKILDMYGEESVVTDLDEAIDHAEAFKSFDDADGLSEECLQERIHYWTDFYQKLKHLKASQRKGNHGND